MGKLAPVIIPEHARNGFYDTYGARLDAYLSGDGEEALSHAYELGREALLSGLGLIDIIETHHAVLETFGTQDPEDAIRLAREALVFLEECLSPYELTHRGYRDAVETAHDMTRFTSVACHEIKAPLSAILSSAGMLSEMLHIEQNSSAGRLIANVLKGAAILNSRAEEMMDLAGLYSGLFSTNLRWVDTTRFLRQLADQLGPEALRHGIDLRLEISGSLPRAEFDPDRLQQVIINLTQNAIKYAAEGGKIVLHAEADRQALYIRISDYGRGLSAEQLSWLSSDASTLNHNQYATGTGLGLMLCKQIMDAHRGKLTARNRAVKGATFEISLPISRRGKS